MTDFISLRGGLTNQYLFPFQGGYLQVEAGDDREFSHYLRQLSRAGVDPREIRYLLLTHHHGDHAGFAARLRELAGCRLIIHREACNPLQRGRNARLPGGGFTNRRVLYSLWLQSKISRASRLSTSFPPVEIESYDIILEGDEFELLPSLGIQGSILHTPGHTPDSISLLLEDGSCFCGDAVMSSSQWLGVKYCCIYLADVEENYRSWRRMIDAGARWFFPAHGKPVSREKLQRYLDCLQQEDLITLRQLLKKTK